MGWIVQQTPQNGELVWTIRAVRCNGITTATETQDEVPSCAACRNVTQIESFRAAVRRGVVKLTTKEKNSLLYQQLRATKQQLNTIVRRVRRAHADPDPKCMSAKVAALMVGEKGGVEELRVLVKCLGSIDSGSLADSKQTAYDFAKSILTNLFVSKQGRRYNDRTKTLLAYTRSLGGGRLYNVLSSTLGLAAERNARGWMHELPAFEYGDSAANFYHAGQIYGVMRRHMGISGDVVVAIVGDESAVVDKPDWNQTTNRVVGWCGRDCIRKCPTLAACRAANLCPQVHQCDWKHGPGELVADEPNSYRGMLESITVMRAANNARILVLCPMHDRLPCIPVALYGVCLSYTGEDYIRPQWNRLNELYDVHVRKILGPKTGNISDGAPTRRKEQLRDLLGKEGERYGMLNGVSFFTMTGHMRSDVRGHRQPDGIHQQCYVHAAKKLFNPIDHPGRSLVLGPWQTIHLSHLELVLTVFPPHTHGLRKVDLSRKGYQAMDFPSLLRCVSKKCLLCLEKLVDGSTPDRTTQPQVSGTLRWLRIIRMFVNMYMSETMTLLQRVETAALVMTYLRLWRSWVHHHPTYTLEKNFVTREAFQDAIICCHFVTLQILCHRDYAPEYPVTLHRASGDPCETTFSGLGSWVMNKRTYTLLEATQTMKSLIWTRCMECMGHIERTRVNKRLEVSWDDTIPKGTAGPNLMDHPTDDQVHAHTHTHTQCRMHTHPQVKTSLMRGERKAKIWAEADGMKPRHRTGWWEKTESADNLRQAEVAGVDVEDDSEANSEGGGEEGDNSSSEGSDSDDNVPLQRVRNDHLLAQGAELLNGLLEGEEGRVFPAKVWVEDAGIWMHKKTVMKQAHDGSMLSNDRVQRARAANDRADRASRVWNLSVDVWSVRPGDNVAVLFDAPKRAFIGRITRVRKKGNKSGWVEYRFPVPLADRSTVTDIYFQCYWYRQQRRPREYCFDHADPNFYCVDTIISPVTMTLVDAPNVYELDDEAYRCMMLALRGNQYW